MSAHILRVLAWVFAFIAVLLALAGWRLSREAPAIQVSDPAQVDSQLISSQQSSFMTAVALRPMAAGQTLSADDLSLVPFPNQIDDSYNNLIALEGRTLVRPVSAGEVLQAADFDLRPRLSLALEPGSRGVAISVDELIGVGGHLAPGDTVDVLYSVQSPHPGQVHGARNLFPRLTLISVGPRFQGEERSPEEEGSSSQVRTAVVAIEADLAPVLLLAENTGRLRLALVGDNESQETPVTPMPTPDQVLAQLAEMNGTAVASLYNQLGNFFYQQDLVYDPVLEERLQRQAEAEQQEAPPRPHVVIQHTGSDSQVLEFSPAQ